MKKKCLHTLFVITTGIQGQQEGQGKGQGQGQGEKGKNK
jgi:hypothetical protein